jgi:hypothetical protein
MFLTTFRSTLSFRLVQQEGTSHLVNKTSRPRRQKLQDEEVKHRILESHEQEECAVIVGGCGVSCHQYNRGEGANNM